MTKKDRKPALEDYAEEQQDQIVDDEAYAPYQNTDESADGYYSDGAYVAKPLASETAPLHSHQPDPQEAYHERLKQLFDAHRIRCRASPSADAVAALDQKHPISFPQGSALALAEWKSLLLSTTPLPAQLCSMDRWTVWRLLRLCERHIRHHALKLWNIPSSLAQWIWSLLGRLDDAFQMGNDDISKVRGLGKCAIFCSARYRLNKPTAGKHQVDGADDDDEDAWNHDDENGESPEGGAGAGDVVDTKVDSDDHITKAQTTGNDDSLADGSIKESPTPIPQLNGEAETSNDVEMEDSVGAQVEEDFSHLFAAKKQELKDEILSQDLQSEIAPETQSKPHSKTEGENASLPNSEEPEQVPSLQTSAVLDLIITVAGDIYGQRDLLWSRQKWEKDVA